MADKFDWNKYKEVEPVAKAPEAEVPVAATPAFNWDSYKEVKEPTAWDKIKDVGGKAIDLATIPMDALTLSPNQFDPQFIKDAKEPFQDFKKGITQGATLNFGDEIAGAVNAGKTAFTAGGDDYTQQIINAYRQGRDEERGSNKVAEERSPILYGGGQLAGAVALGAATGGAGVAGGLGRQVAVNTARGAVEGALGGLGNSEADLTKGEFAQAGIDTAVGAGLGIGAGSVGTAVGAGLGYGAKKFANSQLVAGTSKFLKDFAKGQALKATGFIQSARNRLRDGQEEVIAETLLSRFVPKGSLAEFLSNVDSSSEAKAVKYGFKNLDEVKQILENPDTRKDLFEAPIVTAFADPTENLARVGLAKNYLGESTDRAITGADYMEDLLGDDLPGGWFNKSRAFGRLEDELTYGLPTDTEKVNKISKLVKSGYTQDQAELAVQNMEPYKISGRKSPKEFPDMKGYGDRLEEFTNQYKDMDMDVSKANEVKKLLQGQSNYRPNSKDELWAEGANKDMARIFREEIESSIDSAKTHLLEKISSDQERFIKQLRPKLKGFVQNARKLGFADEDIKNALGDRLKDVRASGDAEKFLEAFDFSNLKNNNKTYGALADSTPVIEKEVNRRGGNASPGLIASMLGGGAGGTVGGIAGGLVAGPGGVVLGGAASSYVGAKVAQTIRNRGPAFLAGTANRLSSLDTIKQLAKTNPQALGKWGGVLASAAARSDSALTAAHYTLSQTDPEYQQMLKDKQENQPQTGDKNDLDL